MLIVTPAESLPLNFVSPAYDAVRVCTPAARVLILRMATPVSSKAEAPKFVPPSRKTTWPVGIPPDELMVAVNVRDAPGVAFAGAVRVAVVEKPATCIGTELLLARKTGSPPYCAVISWIPDFAKIASKVAEPSTKGAVPNGMAPSRNETVPMGVPGLSSAPATLAVIVAFASTRVSEADT